MKTRSFAWIVALAVLPLSPLARGQMPAKTTEIVEEIESDGSINLTFRMTFDAGPWKVWKTLVGDEPSRLRAVLRHQFAAYVIDDFKLERDDLNRVAKVTIHSPAGPELRKDQRLQISVEGWCRLINHAGREWFFSGNNPAAADTLNTIRIVLPANTTEAVLMNTGGPDQVLVYSLREPLASSRIVLWSGVVVMVLGAGLLASGFVKRSNRPVSAVAEGI